MKSSGTLQDAKSCRVKELRLVNAGYVLGPIDVPHHLEERMEPLINYLWLLEYFLIFF